eukprot:977839-Alexandrium_andersonii.AAC.1
MDASPLPSVTLAVAPRGLFLQGPAQERGPLGETSNCESIEFDMALGLSSLPPTGPSVKKLLASPLQ